MNNAPFLYEKAIGKKRKKEVEDDDREISDDSNVGRRKGKRRKGAAAKSRVKAGMSNVFQTFKDT